MLKYLLPATGVAICALLASTPANALTMKECSAKYNTAKDANKLNGATWNEFRKAECGSDDEAAAPAKKETGATAAEKKAAKAAAEAKAKAAAANDDDAKGLTSKECSTKYQAAKDADALGDMKWNDFRKAECGPGASATFAAKPAKKAPTSAAANDDDAKGLTTKECSTKYQAAKDADALGDMKWNDFRKAECGPGASATFAGKPAKKPATTTAAAPSDGKGLSMKECSAKYQTAKTSGTLGSLKWNDFRKTQCGAGADDDDAPAIDEANYTSEPETPVAAAPRGVTFPRSVARKFVSETPAKQRMHTCLEQYYENKDNGTLNGLRWIQKGGGYYSLCNQRLKAGS